MPIPNAGPADTGDGAGVGAGAGELTAGLGCGTAFLCVFYKTGQRILVKRAKLRIPSCQIHRRAVYSLQGLGNVTDNDTEIVTENDSKKSGDQEGAKCRKETKTYQPT